MSKRLRVCEEMYNWVIFCSALKIKCRHEVADAIVADKPVAEAGGSGRWQRPMEEASGSGRWSKMYCMNIAEDRFNTR